MLNVTLSAEGASRLHELIAKGAGKDHSEVLDRMLVYILPQFRKQHQRICELTMTVRTISEAYNAQTSAMLHLQCKLSQCELNLLVKDTALAAGPASIRFEKSAGDPHCSPPLFSAQPPAATPIDTPSVSIEASEPVSAEDVGELGVSDDVRGDEVEFAEMKQSSRPRFFKSVHDLDPSARRKRKAKFCQAFLGLMELYGMDINYASEVVSDMADNQAILSKYQAKRQKVAHEFKQGGPSAPSNNGVCRVSPNSVHKSRTPRGAATTRSNRSAPDNAVTESLQTSATSSRSRNAPETQSAPAGSLQTAADTSRVVPHHHISGVKRSRPALRINTGDGTSGLHLPSQLNGDDVGVVPLLSDRIKSLNREESADLRAPLLLFSPQSPCTANAIFYNPFVCESSVQSLPSPRAAPAAEASVLWHFSDNNEHAFGTDFGFEYES